MPHVFMRLRTTQPAACRQSFAGRSQAAPARAVTTARAMRAIPSAAPQALAETRRPLGEGMRLGCCNVQVRTAKAGKSSGRPARTVTTMGLPIPIVGFLFTPFTIALAYFAAAVRFYSGYDKTVYASAMTTRMALTAMWPVLFIVNSTFRQNFKKAVF